MQSDDDVPARARFQGSFGSLTNYLGQLTPQRLRKSIGRNRERRSGEHVGSERRRRWWESAVGLPMPLGFITVFPYLHFRFFSLFFLPPPLFLSFFSSLFAIPSLYPLLFPVSNFCFFFFCTFLFVCFLSRFNFLFSFSFLLSLLSFPIFTVPSPFSTS